MPLLRQRSCGSADVLLPRLLLQPEQPTRQHSAGTFRLVSRRTVNLQARMKERAPDVLAAGAIERGRERETSAAKASSKDSVDARQREGARLLEDARAL
jgi:hypothetical protein